MQKKMSWNYVASFFVVGRNFYCARENFFLQIGWGLAAATATANPEKPGKSRPFLLLRGFPRWGDCNHERAPVPRRDPKTAAADAHLGHHALFMRALCS